MKEISENDAIIRIPYVIGLILGGAMSLMINEINCVSPYCSQIQFIALIIGIGLIVSGFLLAIIILKSPKTKDVPRGSEYYLDEEDPQ